VEKLFCDEIICETLRVWLNLVIPRESFAKIVVWLMSLARDLYFFNGFLLKYRNKWLRCSLKLKIVIYLLCYSVVYRLYVNNFIKLSVEICLKSKLEICWTLSLIFIFKKIKIFFFNPDSDKQIRIWYQCKYCIKFWTFIMWNLGHWKNF
jgi:hypothetical protein